MPALLAGALAVVGLAPLTAPASAASLYARAAGPVDNTTGYPFWFEDNEGTRLELCLDDPVMCPVVGEPPNPGAPLSMPENFPDESFWWSADAVIDTGTVRARLVLAQEAAFGGPGEVAVGQQVAFSRLRIRIDDLTPGGSYHVITPYGARDVVADDTGRVFETEDVGCLSTPCDFSAGLNGQIGPFLRWDSDLPDGFLGDPSIEHTVTGSPTGQNLFRVEGTDIGGPDDDSIETNLFSVQGRIAQPRGTVDPPGDLYVIGTPVTLTSSFPGESTIYYTLDGSDPTSSPTRTAYAAPYVLTEGPTTLRYAVEYNGQFSEVYTEQYTARDDVSSVSATPGPAVAPAVLEGRQDVTLTASTRSIAADGTVTDEPTVGDIYYSTDGTRPRVDASGNLLGSTKRFIPGQPIAITRTTMVKAISVPTGGESGPVGRFHYVIHNLRAISTEQPYGYPFSMTDIGLPGAAPGDARQNPVGLELCLDDPLCPVVGDLPDPTRGLAFPDNFPDESFWWSGEAQLDLPNARARLVLALEAAFDSPTVQDDHQVAFGRIRVRMDDMVPLATYEIVHPYGVIRATADDTGRVFYTDDNGCMNGPCGFDKLLTQPVGPVLRWSGDDAPAGYVGDGATPHTVVGSPYDTNEFVVHQVTDGDGLPIDPVLVGQTDLFTVQGKLPGPGAIASWQTGTFNHQLDVELTGNPLTTGFRYTTDGTDPVTNGRTYNGPIHIGRGTTVLNYVAVGADGQTSTVEQETYTVDSVAPTLTASPAGGSFASAQDVTVQANEPAQIFFTVDGSTPTQSSPPLVGPVHVASSLTLKAIAVDLAGNVSPVRSWDFTITPPAGGAGAAATPPPSGAAAATALVVQSGTTGAVDVGGATNFSGVLSVNGQALAGAPVVLQTRPLVTGGRAFAEAEWVDIASTTTGADGGYAFTGIKPTATADYRVVFRGDATHAPMVSAAERVKVRAVVKLARPDKRVERRDKVTLRGQLLPVHRGAVVVVHLDGPGRHADKVRATVTRQGTWKATIRAPHRVGKWTAVAVWRGDLDHLGSTSTTRTIRVVR